MGIVIVAALVALAMLVTNMQEQGKPKPLLPPRPPVDLVPAIIRPIECRQARITGYIRTAPYFNPRTADGTSITTAEPIGAASYDVPMGSTVDIEGVGIIRIADRGLLEPGTHIDVAVWSLEEAYQVGGPTGRRMVCIVRPD